VILEALKEVGEPCDNSKQARKKAIVLDCSTSDYFAFRLVLSSSLTKKNTQRDRENRKRVRGTERKRDHQQQETRSREREREPQAQRENRRKQRSSTITIGGNKVERSRERTASAKGEERETEITNNNRKQEDLITFGVCNRWLLLRKLEPPACTLGESMERRL
jgi:hypothetical protein